VKTIWHVFTTPLFFNVKAVQYISVRDNQPRLNNLKYIVVNTLGSVVDMYSVSSLNNLCHVSELAELTLAF